MKLIEIVRNIFWRIKNRKRVKDMFIHVYNFAPGDPVIRGYKYAIHYGIFYRMRSGVKDGMPDMEKRSRKQDIVIGVYSHPQDRKRFLRNLLILRKRVEQSNIDGLFSAGSNKEQNKIEAGIYSNAVSDLDLMIKGTKLFPITWKIVFLRS